MKNIRKRREFLSQLVACGLYFFAGRLVAQTDELAPFVLSNAGINPDNFHRIYDDPKLKSEFLNFLRNVYNIYPEETFHDLISRSVSRFKTDEEIYNSVLSGLHEIKPLFSELTYALPALAKQKKELAAETMQFLNGKKGIDGYLEIGTPGRYIGELKKQLEIRGDLALVNVTDPSYSPIDLAERGQLNKAARFIPLNDYKGISKEFSPDANFEVITNYIGFHHARLDVLNDFVVSIHRVLKPGGTFILRDHDVVNEPMNHLVSLAHDVFNAGLKNDWNYNHSEIRNFRSLDNWISYLKDRGFQYKGRQIFQEGDPTKNALIEFVKA